MFIFTKKILAGKKLFLQWSQTKTCKAAILNELNSTQQLAMATISNAMLNQCNSRLLSLSWLSFASKISIHFYKNDNPWYRSNNFELQQF